MMSSWSSKRQSVYGIVIVLFVVLVVGVPVYLLFFNTAPTCFDGKQNGNESGVDCGGSCSKNCEDYSAQPPIILWAQDFQVVKGQYNLVAYIENPNVDYVAYPVHYQFTAYDANGVQIGFRDGYADVPDTKTFPIFEQNFSTGDSIPAKIFFKYLDPGSFTWKAVNSTGPELSVTNTQKVDSTSVAERIETNINNTTVKTYQNVEVVAIVYDANSNAMAASRTFVDTLPGKSTSHVVFTWPSVFPAPISKIEIIPKLPVQL